MELAIMTLTLFSHKFVVSFIIDQAWLIQNAKNSAILLKLLTKVTIESII